VKPQLFRTAGCGPARPVVWEGYGRANCRPYPISSSGSAPPGPEQSRRAEEAANQEKVALATALRDTLHLELSETKTLVTPVTKTLRS